MEDLNPTIQIGDTVIVDEGFANGGYEATVEWTGKIYAKIRVEDSTWDIMKNRLKKKNIRRQ